MKNPAKFNMKVKKEILARDRKCIICWELGFWSFHHVYFWQDAEYWDDRNNVNKWVLLCNNHHLEAHSCKRWEGIRQDCINYLKNIYG